MGCFLHKGHMRRATKWTQFYKKCCKLKTNTDTRISSNCSVVLLQTAEAVTSFIALIMTWTTSSDCMHRANIVTSPGPDSRVPSTCLMYQRRPWSIASSLTHTSTPAPCCVPTSTVAASLDGLTWISWTTDFICIAIWDWDLYQRSGERHWRPITWTAQSVCASVYDVATGYTSTINDSSNIFSVLSQQSAYSFKRQTLRFSRV